MQAFLRRFAAPLVLGAAPACGPYLGPRATERLGIVPARTDEGDAFWKGVRSRVCAVDPAPPAPPGRTTTVLLCAAHDLLASAHPDAPTLLGYSTRLLRRHTAAVLERELPTTVGEALSRHAVVDACMRAVRVDITLRWWTGTAVFQGTEPPQRLLAWPSLRRVRREENRVPLVRAGLSQDSSRLRAARRGLLDAMLVISPVTPLLMAMDGSLPIPLDLRQPGRGGEPTYASLHFTEHLPLRTHLADLALASGFMGPAVTLSAAVNSLLTSASPPAWAVARAIRLICALHERRLFAESMARELKHGRPLPLADLATDAEARNRPSVRMVYALWKACRQLAPWLGMAHVTRELQPLAEEVDREMDSPQLTEQAESFVRAMEARLS
ncbi:MAG: hypothetical protein AB2A00_16300 [Myxococcota bacterium]